MTPATGDLQVTAATGGNPADLDPDGYTVAVDRGAGQVLPINGSVTFSQLAAGVHTVALTGVASNCTVSGQNPLDITVTAGATAHTFQIACAPILGLTGRIAFVSGRDGNAEIYVMNPNGTGVTRLTNNGATDGQPAWSPDGTKLAFVSDRDGNDEIYVMNADGSGVTRLTNSGAVDHEPAWSPDGTKIAFVRLVRTIVNRRIVFSSDIDVMNADGSGITQLTRTGFEHAPAWSPDGTKIAFASVRDGNPEIYVMHANGSGVTRLTNDTEADVDPAWSPDGTKIAFVSNRDGNFEIYLMNAGGSPVTRLTHDAASDDEPAWSHDGTKVAFVSDRDGNSEIYMMNADGSNPTRLTNNPASDTGPAWRR